MSEFISDKTMARQKRLQSDKLPKKPDESRRNLFPTEITIHESLKSGEFKLFLNIETPQKNESRRNLFPTSIVETFEIRQIQGFYF